MGTLDNDLKLLSLTLLNTAKQINVTLSRRVKFADKETIYEFDPTANISEIKTINNNSLLRLYPSMTNTNAANTTNTTNAANTNAANAANAANKIKAELYPLTIAITTALKNPEHFCKKSGFLINDLFKVGKEDFYKEAVEWVRQAISYEGSENKLLASVFNNRRLRNVVIPKILKYPDGIKYVPKIYHRLQ